MEFDPSHTYVEYGHISLDCATEDRIKVYMAGLERRLRDRVGPDVHIISKRSSFPGSNYVELSCTYMPDFEDIFKEDIELED